MAINVKTVICPACGAKVNYDENQKTTHCEFCGAVLDMTEVYGEKRDRERDDIQDMQIRDIMNNMYRNNTANRAANVQANVQSAKKVAKIIAIVFVSMFCLSIFATIAFSVRRYSDMMNKSNNKKETVSEIDPFDKLNISYYGVSGKAYARLSDSNKYEVSSIEKTISETENLKNGDTITVKYNQDTAKDYNTKYVLTKTEKTYTVEGLDEYLDDVNLIDAEDLEVLKKNAIRKAEESCAEENFPSLEGSFDVYAIYTMVKKDFSRQESVFVVSFDYKESDDIKTGYYMAKYSNMIKRPTGEFKINFSAGDFNYTRDSYFNGFTVMSGHANWDDVYTDVYLNNKAEWNIHEDYIKTVSDNGQSDTETEE